MMRMAKKPRKTARAATKPTPAPKRPAKNEAPASEPRKRVGPLRWLWRWMRRLVLLWVGVMLIWISAYAVIDPPTTPYIVSERLRLGMVDREWVPINEIAPSLPRSVVAAEDANFCSHFGFETAAIRAALEDGAQRGGSTITQQVVKNVFLWQGRSWSRKALEALLTPAVEAIWTKQRILEVYLNVAEFDEGVFGVEAAARHYFDTGPERLTARQSALLAAILPNPKQRSAAHPGQAVTRRARQIQDGAATILADGRSACFETKES